MVSPSEANERGEMMGGRAIPGPGTASGRRSAADLMPSEKRPKPMTPKRSVEGSGTP